MFTSLAITLLLALVTGLCPATTEGVSRLQTKSVNQKSKTKPAISKSCVSEKKAAEVNARFDELIAKATETGPLSIIAGLCVEFVPEGNLPNAAAVKNQRQAIAKARDDLLEKLRPFSVSSVKRYEFIPYVAMRLDVAALKFLKQKQLVASVEEDLPTPAN